MLYSFIRLLPLLGLAGSSIASPLSHLHRATYASEEQANQTLLRRAGETAAQFFTVGDGGVKGGCSSSSGTVDTWMQEAALLHAAVQKAYTDYKKDIGYRILWTVWMGVKFTPQGDLSPDDPLEDFLWPAIGGRISAVAQFLAGAGLPGAATTEKPWVFCNDDYVEFAPFDQIARDKDGDQIILDGDEETQTPTEWLTVGQIFPQKEALGTINAWFVDQLHGYDFFEKPWNPLCTKPGRYALTTRSPTTPDNNGYDIAFPTFDKHLLFCPRALSPPAGQSHSYPSLSQAIANYPSAGGNALDKWLPVSATMYHELYHLTDHIDDTADPYTSMRQIADASMSQNIDARRQISTNPESFTFFAVAVYLYQNPPQGKDAILFAPGPTTLDIIFPPSS